KMFSNCVPLWFVLQERDDILCNDIDTVLFFTVSVRVIVISQFTADSDWCFLSFNFCECFFNEFLRFLTVCKVFYLEELTTVFTFVFAFFVRVFIFYTICDCVNLCFFFFFCMFFFFVV